MTDKWCKAMMLLAAAAASVPGGAVAQTANCAPRDVVAQRLAETYGETRQSAGLAANGAVVEVYASGRSGSWTITVTAPAGLTCLVASGRAFETVTDTLTDARTAGADT